MSTMPRNDGAAANALAEVTLAVEGMTCSACATRLEGALGQAPGIRRAAVNFALERADVSYDPARISPAGVAQVVVHAGFQVPRQSFSFPIGGMTCSACSTKKNRRSPTAPFRRPARSGR